MIRSEVFPMGHSALPGLFLQRGSKTQIPCLLLLRYERIRAAGFFLPPNFAVLMSTTDGGKQSSSKSENSDIVE